MFLAAGLGTRLRPFTREEAKPVLPVLGIPMAQLAFDLLSAAGVKEAVANVHWQADRTEARLRSLERGFELKISREEGKILGGAGGIRQALEHLEPGPFFYVNGDVLADVDFAALSRRHEELKKKHGTLMTLALCEPGLGGGGSYREVKLSPGGDVVAGFGEVVTGKDFFGGLAVVEPGLFRGFKPGAPAEMFDEVLKPAAARGKLGIYRHAGLWFDVGDARAWRDTHFGLARAWSQGRVPEVWRKRLASSVEQVGPEMWVTKGELRGQIPKGWQGPLFFGGGAAVPERLGPETVLYGPAGPALKKGVGRAGDWVSIS